MDSFTSTELQLLRLLERTKRLAKENISENVWKVSANTKVLNNLIQQLQNNECCNKEIIMEYLREVSNLKLMADAENKACAEERLKAVEKIPRIFGEPKAQESEESIAGLRTLQKSIYHSDLRKTLLSSRKNKNEEDEGFMKQEVLEENLAKDLLSMTMSLKTVMSAANDVIKEDNARLSKMQQQVDKNKEYLEVEGTRLEKHAYKCGFDCMRIFIVIFVFWTFLAMVILMKIAPKRAYN